MRVAPKTVDGSGSTLVSDPRSKCTRHDGTPCLLYMNARQAHDLAVSLVEGEIRGINILPDNKS